MHRHGIARSAGDRGGGPTRRRREEAYEAGGHNDEEGRDDYLDRAGDHDDSPATLRPELHRRGALASLQSTGRNVSVNVVTLNATAMISVSMNTASLVEPEGRTSRVRVGSPTSLTDMVVSSGAFTLNGGTQTGITCRESRGIEAPYGFELLTSGATWILNQLSAGVRTPLASGPLPAAPAKGPQELVPSDGFEKAALKFTAAQFIPLELSCRGAAGSPGQIVGKAFGEVVVTLPVGAMPGPGGAGFVLFSDRSAGSSTSKGVFGPITITAI